MAPGKLHELTAAPGVSRLRPKTLDRGVDSLVVAVGVHHFSDNRAIDPHKLRL